MVAYDAFKFFPVYVEVSKKNYFVHLQWDGITCLLTFVSDISYICGLFKLFGPTFCWIYLLSYSLLNIPNCLTGWCCLYKKTKTTLMWSAANYKFQWFQVYSAVFSRKLKTFHNNCCASGTFSPQEQFCSIVLRCGMDFPAGDQLWPKPLPQLGVLLLRDPMLQVSLTFFSISHFVTYYGSNKQYI